MKINVNYNNSINNKLYKKQSVKNVASPNLVFKSLYMNASISSHTSVKKAPLLTDTMVIFGVREKIKQLSQVDRDALYRVYEDFNKDFFLTDFFDFLKRDVNPDCLRFEALIQRLKLEGVRGVYLKPLLELGENDKNEDTDFNKINDYLDFRLRALNNKNLLGKYNHVATTNDVDDIVLRNIKSVSKALEIIGEKALIYSFKEKKDNVLAFVDDLSRQSWDLEIYNELRKKTNPKSTPVYSFYEKDIEELKALYPQIKETERLESLKKVISATTREKRDLLEASIKDPKEILEKALIISALNKNGLKTEAKKVLKILNPKTLEDKNFYNQTLNEILYGYYGLKTPDKRVVEKLDLQSNKHLPKLFYAGEDFKKAFKDLIILLNENPDKSNLEIFNNLPKNKQTKLEFEQLGINYDKWISFNPDSKLEFKLGEKNVITARKVNMNDISKALFLGDEALCCTRVNGIFPQSAVGYITSKMIQAIEVCHNGVPVANTMCYLAKVNGKVALVLDNIEVKTQYRCDEMIRKAFFEYAKQFVKDIDCPNMPIMLLNKRLDIKDNDLKSYYYDMDLIGSTAGDKVYFDFKTKEIVIDESSRHISNVELIPISKNAPIGSSSMLLAERISGDAIDATNFNVPLYIERNAGEESYERYYNNRIV